MTALPCLRPHPLRRLTALLLLGLACASGQAGEPAATRSIYQQRLPDGRILLTDRPGAGTPVQRTWTVPVEPPLDAQAQAEAQARRAASQAEAEAVNERIRQSLERQRQLETELEIERLRREQAAATLAAERERAARERAERERMVRPDSEVLVLPGWQGPPYHPRHPGRHVSRPPWKPPVQEPPPSRPPEPPMSLKR